MAAAEPGAPRSVVEAVLTIAEPEQMERLGARIAGLLEAGDLVRLNGELGAGKTTLTRGLGRALGARGEITSPTFVLARTHPTSRGIPLVHVDAYRLATAVELDDLDIDWPASVVVVEWGDGKLDGVADSWLEVDIERPRGGALDPDGLDAPTPRTVVIRAVGARWSVPGVLPALAEAGH